MPESTQDLTGPALPGPVETVAAIRVQLGHVEYAARSLVLWAGSPTTAAALRKIIEACSEGRKEAATLLARMSGSSKTAAWNDMRRGALPIIEIDECRGPAFDTPNLGLSSMGGSGDALAQLETVLERISAVALLLIETASAGVSAEAVTHMKKIAQRANRAHLSVSGVASLT